MQKQRSDNTCVSVYHHHFVVPAVENPWMVNAVYGDGGCRRVPPPPHLRSRHDHEL